MQIKLYDTMTRSKRVFEPQDPTRVTMYVCGPTVYGRAHIGNARPAVVFDVLARLLRHQYGAEHVVYARNITDIDDKINASAAAQGVDISVISQKFEGHYLADMAALGVLPPDLAPHATVYVPQMIAMITDLEAKGAAYAAQGHVLFDVTMAAKYPALSPQTLEQMHAGSRVEVAPYKKNPADFVMWKPSTADQPGWASPWGRGRPGWHIECSAMIAAELGTTVDIHGGGLDLIFPHHENELAQSACAHNAPLANYWLHNGFLSMGDTKMSKSLGNVVSVADLLAQGWDGEVLRLALLSAHYRQPLAWTESLLVQSKAILDRWYRALAEFENGGENMPTLTADENVIDYLFDDMGVINAISTISQNIDACFQSVAQAVSISGEYSVEALSARMGAFDLTSRSVAAARLLGFLQQSSTSWFQRLDAQNLDVGQINQQIAARTAARARRDFTESDRIRDELAAQAIVLEDGASGTTWRRG